MIAKIIYRQEGKKKIKIEEVGEEKRKGKMK